MSVILKPHPNVSKTSTNPFCGL